MNQPKGKCDCHLNQNKMFPVGEKDSKKREGHDTNKGVPSGLECVCACRKWAVTLERETERLISLGHKCCSRT